jgi:acetylornithine/succinyldiaminopimelate/putrescine aminotransferase
MSDSLSSLYGGRGIALTHGNGSSVYDTDGREYIDFFNGHGAALFGHGNKALHDALIEASNGIWTCGAGFESSIREELGSKLAGLVGDGRVFLSNSGTEAIEAALKLAVAMRPGRKRILACRRAFHGRTCGALALTFNPKYRTPFAAVVPQSEHYAPEEIAEHIDKDVAVVFIEPVQGEGGVFPIPTETGRAITEACKNSGAILVADEVQAGLGRCGAMTASSLVGLDPDIICVAKGLAGGLAIGAAVWKKELGDFPPHSHGSTYGGNEIAARVAVAALDLIAKNNLPAQADEYGKFFRAELAKINNGHIKDIRGLGLLNGVELDIAAADVIKALQNNGVLSLAAGPRTLRFLPSYAATKEDMSQVAGILSKTLEAFK